MSLGQMLLTVGVALWVFDAKKLPQLMVDLTAILETCQRYYRQIWINYADKFHQNLQQQTLIENQLKAKQYDDFINNKSEP